MQDLLNLLARGKMSVAALRQIHAASRGEREYVDRAISVLRQLDPEQSRQAAWLLVAAARDGLVQQAHLPKLAIAAEEAVDWAARAELVQLFAITDVPPDLRPAIFPFLEDCSRDRHAILRVWALTAVLRWGDDSRYRAAANHWIEQAKVDPQKAVQARLRRLGLIPYPPKRRAIGEPRVGRASARPRSPSCRAVTEPQSR